mgnify:CR=1 FL=1
MLETGNWVVPFVQDRARLNKPPLIYWLQAGSVWTLTGGDTSRDAIWMYRLPGMLCTILSVLLTWRLGRRLLDARAAWLGAALLAICPLVVVDAHQARSDQLLLLTVVMTQWALWRVFTPTGRFDPSAMRAGSGRGHWIQLAPNLLLLGFALGISILAKGPVGPMIAGLTALAFVLSTRAWQQQHVGAWLVRVTIGCGLCFFIASIIVAPWVILVARQVGWDQYTSIVYDETIARSAAAKEGHGLFPGVYVITLVGLFFPGSMLTGAAVIAACRDGFARGTDQTRARMHWHGRTQLLFLICWALPSWLVFELLSTRLVHYVMPLYPALALLSGRAVLRASGGMLASMQQRTTRIGLVIWASVGAILTGGATIGIGFLAAKHAADSASGDANGSILLAVGIGTGVICIGLCASAGFFALRGKPLRATLLASIAMVVGLGVLLSLLLPNARTLWPARNAMQAMRSVDPSLSRPLAAVGFHEDSQIFLSHGRLTRLSDGDVAAWSSTYTNGLIVVRRVPKDLLSNPGQLALNSTHQLQERGWREVARAGGFNLNRGKWEDLMVLSRDATSADDTGDAK